MKTTAGEQITEAKNFLKKMDRPDPWAPLEPFEVERILDHIREWVSLRDLFAPNGPQPPAKHWEDSIFQFLIRHLSRHLALCKIDVSVYQNALDCSQPIAAHPYPCDLILSLLRKCYLARNPWNLSDEAVREIRSELMELGFATLSGDMDLAREIAAGKISYMRSHVDAAQQRGDQRDKITFKGWVQEKDVRLTRIKDLPNFEGIPENIREIVERRSWGILKEWYKEVPGRPPLSGGRPKHPFLPAERTK